MDGITSCRMILKIRPEIQRTLSGAFGAVCCGRGWSLSISTPMPPSAPRVVWGTVWVNSFGPQTASALHLVEGSPSRKWGGNKSTRRIITKKEGLRWKRNILKKFDLGNSDREKITPH